MLNATQQAELLPCKQEFDELELQASRTLHVRNDSWGGGSPPTCDPGWLGSITLPPLQQTYTQR
jgi:hypothetical protein